MVVKKKKKKINQYFKTNRPENKTVLVMGLPPSWQLAKDLKESMTDI